MVQGGEGGMTLSITLTGSAEELLRLQCRSDESLAGCCRRLLLASPLRRDDLPDGMEWRRVAGLRLDLQEETVEILFGGGAALTVPYWGETS